MIKLNRTDRRVIAEKFMELGNLFIGGFVITVIISEKHNFSINILGFILLISFYAFAIIIMSK